MNDASLPEIPRAYKFMQACLRLLVRLFFREVEITGADHIPFERGGVIVSWHPNGLVDPGLILTQFPRQVVFGARHSLFNWPLLGFVLRQIGTVPIYRPMESKRSDPEARKKANQASIAALANEVARGSYSALFPEGTSHDAPHLLELKAGVARLYYRARQLAPKGGPPPVIIPVGLHYDEKRMFRSRALVWFHPPIELPQALDVTPAEDEPEDVAKARATALTAEVERVLSDVVHATEDWELHFLLHRARKLVRAERAAIAGAEPGRPAIGEKALAFARVRKGYYARMESDPAQVADIRHRVQEYDEDLRSLRLDDHDLDRDPRLVSPWLAALLLLQFVLVFLLLPPVRVFGYVANGPTALALWGLTRIASRYKKDEATIKILVGAIAFPVTWLLAALLGFVGHEYLHDAFPAIPQRPLLAAAAVAALAALGGACALRYLHVAQETARAVRVRLTRRRRRAAVARLKVERAELYGAVMALAEGLELPGEVGSDGTIRAQ